MVESEATAELKLIVPKGVGLFELQYRGYCGEPDVVPMDPAAVPPHAIGRVQDSINWVAAKMGEHPRCESRRGWDKDPNDFSAGMVHYSVRPTG